MKLKLSPILFTFGILFLVNSATMAQQPAAKKTVAKRPLVQKPAAPKPAATALPVAKTYPNGIQLNVKGFTVQDAYLVFEDGTKVPADNKIDLSQRISLVIKLTKGFKEINGKVFPGGSEKIVLSTGDKILESDDLFTAFDSTGVSPVDAKYITLKAVINEIKDKSNAVNISVRIWDKKTQDNEITGTYTIYIK